jgi:hypothetical protein
VLSSRSTDKDYQGIAQLSRQVKLFFDANLKSKAQMAGRGVRRLRARIFLF